MSATAGFEAIGPDLQIAGTEIIDATDMIVMPGFVDTHHHMWARSDAISSGTV
jgi:cytosine/adenosine deaminase-related metal-dependent hydrolase